MEEPGRLVEPERILVGGTQSIPLLPTTSLTFLFFLGSFFVHFLSCVSAHRDFNGDDKESDD